MYIPGRSRTRPATAYGLFSYRQIALNGQTPHAGRYNILFLLTDQERFFRPGELPAGFRLPGHERLECRRGEYRDDCASDPSCHEHRWALHEIPFAM
jgi:hypothetical protein